MAETVAADKGDLCLRRPADNTGQLVRIAAYCDHIHAIAMLELRPSCEHCHKPLPPESAEARICSFECTFCAPCVEAVLGNVCPNCGGGFVPRPIRPVRNWKNDNYLGAHPARTEPKHRPVDPAVHAAFSHELRRIPPEQR